MRLNTNKVVAHAAPHIRNLFHLLGSARLTLALKRDESEIKKEATAHQNEQPRFHQTRIENDAERRFEFERFRQRAQTRVAQLHASTKFYYDEDGTPRFATPEKCLTGEVSFEKAMTFQEWLSLHRATR